MSKAAPVVLETPIVFTVLPLTTAVEATAVALKVFTAVPDVVAPNKVAPL